MNTNITVRGDVPLSTYAGQPYTHVTYDGEVMHGITEVDGVRLIVRFADGRWAYCDTQWDTNE